MKFGEIPFLLALGIVALIALLGVATVLLAGEPGLVPLPFVAAILFAAAYLYASHEPSEGTAAAPEEPFDDPVEEADRIGDLGTESSRSEGGSEVPAAPPAPTTTAEPEGSARGPSTPG